MELVRSQQAVQPAALQVGGSNLLCHACHLPAPAQRLLLPIHAKAGRMLSQIAQLKPRLLANPPQGAAGARRRGRRAAAGGGSPPGRHRDRGRPPPAGAPEILCAHAAAAVHKKRRAGRRDDGAWGGCAMRCSCVCLHGSAWRIASTNSIPAVTSIYTHTVPYSNPHRCMPRPRPASLVAST